MRYYHEHPTMIGELIYKVDFFGLWTLLTDFFNKNLGAPPFLVEPSLTIFSKFNLAIPVFYGTFYDI